MGGVTVIVARVAAGIAIAAFAVGVTQELREFPSCQSDIVSSTVVSTFCGHRDGNAERLDLVILWRGQPGWFQSPFGAGTGAGAGRRVLGRVSQSGSYGGVLIAFDADFDAGVVTIGPSTVRLDHVNLIVIDDVDAARRIGATGWIDPTLPLDGDWNLSLARRSPALVDDLRCQIPMPPWPSLPFGPRPTVRVVTVCERLRKP